MFAEGDRVVLVPARSREDQDGVVVTITEVGSKWAYAEHRHNKYQFDRVTGEGKRDAYGATCNVYYPVVYEARCRRRQLESEVRTALRKANQYNWVERATDEQLRQLVAAINGTAQDDTSTPEQS